MSAVSTTTPWQESIMNHAQYEAIVEFIAERIGGIRALAVLILQINGIKIQVRRMNEDWTVQGHFILYASFPSSLSAPELQKVLIDCTSAQEAYEGVNPGQEWQENVSLACMPDGYHEDRFLSLIERDCIFFNSKFPHIIYIFKTPFELVQAENGI